MKRILNSSYIAAIFAMLLVFGVGESIAQKPVIKKKPVVKRKVVVKPATPVYQVDSGTVMRDGYCNLAKSAPSGG
ncbi:MAG: hypothetical protein ACKVQW_14225 [Pyrinomonadaceae bacterium]